MTEHENTNEAPLSLEAGTLLKNKRESLGMSQKQIADRLRLRVSVIEDIENNRFESQQVATFTRGYLRSYAKVVGLDEKMILTVLEQTTDIPPKEQEIEMQSFSRKTKQEQHNSRIMLLTWVIGIIIIGISAAWWWQNQQENSLTKEVTESSVESPQPTVQELADIDLMTAKELIANSPEDVTLTNDEVVETQTTLVGQQTDILATKTEETADLDSEQSVAVIETEKEEQPAPLVPEGMTLLTMKFKADCWIQVKDTDGKTLVSGTHKPGQDVELAGKAPFNVILGAPEGVTMTFASEPVDLSGYTSGKVARFTLPL
ncbi:cytoskeleton protein RodZ [Vibrio sp. ES.051]|uniref:cytoskeleton protein RodZ n=1 Tax=Vibrio sp. ES.051 TaxID=1761909 RepID=UPI000BF54F5F|nr:cytoskeleton protein RodZ [Vibrio sp. ES.051]PFG46246.1 cytoskeleton protein RodZ [Vibrio sp. ES.051]